MADSRKTISLRRFRERAVEITETVDIAIRDPDGNFRIIGYFTPYATHPEDAVELPTPTGELPEAHVTVHTVDGAALDFGEGTITETKAKLIRTPQDAAAAVQPLRPFPKSVQAGRKRSR